MLCSSIYMKYKNKKTNLCCYRSGLQLLLDALVAGRRLGASGSVGDILFVELVASFMSLFTLQKFIKPYTYHTCLFFSEY